MQDPKQPTVPAFVCPFGDAGCPFPEEHLSGALDGVLTRVEHARVAQRVRECSHCREVYEELSLNREAARSTFFRLPADDQWDETPRGLVSRWARNLGWLLYALLTLAALALTLVWPEILQRERIGLWLVRCAVLATLAVLVSAGIDRWRAAKSDLYRGVKR
jgi:predicted anti-sigma-YlaC factor YlaD